MSREDWEDGEDFVLRHGFFPSSIYPTSVPRGFSPCEECTLSVTCEARGRCLFPDLEDGIPLGML
ncbi:hypothetical protein ACGF12_35780 [Kitasatospora sp. NPDC048296]|uniref:hypothetical protein n=1 Tax=Kitasatospora sp. NPDC048296 TaxID=3364048 RepID=UPI003719C916